jgi:hypothetical protein
MGDPHQDVTAAESPLIQEGLRRAAPLSDRVCSDLHDSLGSIAREAGESATCAGTLPQHTKRQSVGWLTEAEQRNYGDTTVGG